MNKRAVMLGGIVLLGFVGGALIAAASTDDQLVARGRYLVATSGCNDCHTPGYPESNGQTPVEQWLSGNTIGFQGPWGTTYAANLRLTMGALTEQEWLQRARSPLRPPMPWFSLRDMEDQDLRAVYLFVRSLGPTGEPVPPYAAPGQPVTTPYYDFVPKNLPTSAQITQ